MKVLLVDPPRFDKESKLDLKLQHNLPKIGILSLASVLIKDDVKTAFLDLQQMSVNSDLKEEDITAILRKLAPDIIAISYNVTEVINVQGLSKIIRETLPSVKIVMGGSQPSVDPGAVFKFIPETDFVVYGEGEETIVELVKALENKHELSTIRGLAFRNRDSVIINDKRELISDLDKLPFPAWNIADIKRYSPSPTALYAKGLIINTCTSRGCAFDCAYCNKQVYGKIWRGRSAKNIIGEIKMLRDKYKAKNIYFFEDTFTLDKKRIHDLCRLLIKDNINMPWSCMTRTDCVDLRLLKSMKKAGCRQIAYGIESGSDRINKLMQRNFDLKNAQKICGYTRRLGIETRGFYMIGYPTETKKEIMQTIYTAIKLDLDISFLSIIMPYPGTKLWDMVKERINFKTWKQFDVYNPGELIYITENMTEKELNELYSLAYRKIYLRPKYIIRQLLSIIKNPYTIRRYRIGSFFSLIKG